MPIVRESVGVAGEESSVCHENFPRVVSVQVSAFDGSRLLVWICCGRGMAAFDFSSSVL